jgi:citrate lyase subunit beta/citryl-CoA lyase
MLFVPGSRADMVAKIDRFGPDVAVIDLEDAVAVGAKVEARNTVVAAISALHEAERTRLYIRVNPVDSPWFAEDLPAAAPTGVSGIVIPKLSSVRDLERVQQSLAAAAWPTAQIVVGIETVRAVADARSLLDAGVHGAYFGAEDYIADIGGKRTTAGHEVLSALLPSSRMSGSWTRRSSRSMRLGFSPMPKRVPQLATTARSASIRARWRYPTGFSLHLKRT